MGCTMIITLLPTFIRPLTSRIGRKTVYYSPRRGSYKSTIDCIDCVQWILDVLTYISSHW